MIVRFWFALFILSIGTAVAHAGDDGQRIFNRVCATCHMVDARGVPNTYPPLHENVGCRARQPQGREYLAGVLKYGLEGPIVVDRSTINGYMPMQPQLSSEEKASVLNYVASLSPQCSPVEPFTATEVDRALSEGEWDSEALMRLREALPQPSVPAVARVDSARDFTLYCQGCHTPRGDSVAGAVPELKGNLRVFASSPEGRAFLVRVPGVALSPLDDTRLASLLNWMIQSLGTDTTLTSFEPFTGNEVASYRGQAFVDVESERQRLVADLRAAGRKVSE